MPHAGPGAESRSVSGAGDVAANAFRLLGRDTECAHLLAMWSDATAGAGRSLLLDGDAGVGKTALAAGLVAAAEDAAATAWVPCVEQPVPMPLGVVQAVAGQLGLAVELFGGEPDSDRRLVVIADTLAAGLAAARGPLLIVVDDVHWADEPSLRVLAMVAPHLARARVLVVATLRSGEAISPEQRAAIGTLRRASERVAVLPLSAQAARAVAAAAASHLLPAPLIGRIEERARGNPLFLRELAILAAADPGSLDVATSLPDAVTAVIERRLAGLDAGTRGALVQLAVCGDDLAWPVAAAALGCSAAELVELVSSAVAARVFQEPAGGRLRFSHPLVRDALVGSVPYATRVGMHQRIARRLAQLAGERQPVDVALVAGHFCAAAPAGDAAAAVEWAMRAAAQASTGVAYAAAAAWYGKALDALALEPAAADRLDLLLDWATALEAAGDRSRARAISLDAFQLAQSRGDAPRGARAALGVAGGSGFEVSISDDEQVRVLDAALDLLGDGDAPLRALLLARRSVAATLSDTADRRRATAEEALDIAMATGDAHVQCAALAALCDALAGPRHVERRLALAGEMAVIGRNASDSKARLLALRLAAVAQLEQGDMAGFDRTVEEFEIVADRIRQPLYDWYVPLWRAMRRAMAGDTARARQLVDQAEAIGTVAGSHNTVLLVHTLRTFLAVDTGDREGMILPDLDAVGGMIEPWVVILRGYAAAAQGDMATARRAADELPGVLPLLPEDSEYLPTVAQASRLVAWIGGHPVAATLYELLLPHRQRFVVEGIGAYVHGSVERFLGLLAAAVGRPESAAHFATARAAHQRFGAGLLVRLVDEEAGTSPRQASVTVPVQGCFRRNGDTWTVRLDGREVHVRDSKGMQDLAALVALPRRDVAAMRLAGRAEGTAGRGVEVLDSQARAEYRRRLADLDMEIAAAESDADLVRLERVEAERDFLVAELSRAVGLGDRSRRLGDDVERARTAVTARIRDAVRRLEKADPAVGEHFRRSLRTGMLCTYDPPVEVAWEL